ncbi:MAG TPA: laccase domain-containing protein [Firmicutes bacterium]|nr:laccase domain-containing protein [Bacillota bacterium]
MFLKRRKGALNVLQSDLIPIQVKHAFTTRRITPSSDFPSNENANFRIDSLPETAKYWVHLRDLLFTREHVCYVHSQVHGGHVRLIDPDKPEGVEKEIEGFRFRILGEGDGIIKPFTRKPIFLTINTADCLPCLIYDTNSGAVGAVHAGWRSLAADIPAEAVRIFGKAFGSAPKHLLWAVGPSVDMDNYEVGREVIAAMETAGYADSDWKYDSDTRPGWLPTRGGKFKLDLSACLSLRLRNLNVPDKNVDICPLSTFTNPASFYSYRRDKEIRGLQASVIG